jgi:hypothetical protein
MSSLKENAAKTSHAVAETAKEVGHKVAAGAGKAADFVKEKTGMGGNGTRPAGIKEHMDVIASCGKKIGVVDHVEAAAIKLTRNDSPDGMHHFIPVAWVERVDAHVHLKKNSQEAEQGWKSNAAECGCGG